MMYLLTRCGVRMGMLLAMAAVVHKGEGQFTQSTDMEDILNDSNTISFHAKGKCVGYEAYGGNFTFSWNASTDVVWCGRLVSTKTPSSSYSNRREEAKAALDFVEKIASSDHCTVGTGNVLPLRFDPTSWVTLTDSAIRTANYMSLVLASSKNSFEQVPESTFFNFVRNNVHGKSLIFGSAIALEPIVFGPQSSRLFCPYASKTASGSVKFIDIAQSYNYTSNNTEWYAEVRAKTFSDVTVATDINGINSTEEVLLRQPVANYSDGLWTWPYYDCGGGNIWMVTYSSPILALNDLDTPVFRGVATVDIELTNIDINQCDFTEDEEASSLDVFRGTHSCQPTTKCVPVSHMGFRASAYNCECVDGYYFPDTDAVLRAYKGVDIEHYLTQHNDSTDPIEKFQCLPCPRACATCVDATPCLFQSSMAIRIIVVLFVILLILGCGALSIITFKYRKALVMKTASPIFLQIMIAGAMLMCISVFLLYPEATDLLCTLFVWPFHMGFILLYGSLLVKTWRISVIFNNRKKVHLPDKVLLQRLAPLPILMIIFLICWSLVSHPHTTVITMADSKKFYACSFDYWNYGVFGAEILMLLFGVYLCFTVRKAPAHFNESKHITWSTYNAIILGIFIITLTQLLAETAGPDIEYILLLLQLQVFDTIALCLIFGPKIWNLCTESGSDSQAIGTITVTGRFKQSPYPTSTYTEGSRHFGVQVVPDDLDFSTPSNTPDTSLSMSTWNSSRLRTNRVYPSSPTADPARMSKKRTPSDNKEETSAV